MNKSCLDPDYEFACATAERKKIRLEKDQNEALQKSQTLLNQQFEIELKERQRQLELIQDRISRAQKTLHLLRYALVTSYYNRKDLKVTFSDTFSEGENSAIAYEKRIHPALKKLIGKGDSNLASLYISGLRNRLKPKHNIDSTNTIQEHTGNDPVSSQDKNETQYEYVLKGNDIEKTIDNVRNRRKQKYRILIGNISKWMPSEGSTHKWMVYVRGPKDSPDISNIIQKVIFHLHPSYKPNDIVELKSAPFHLSRRGWGEFPLRVKIYFHSSLNKPVDVIHNLKLDRTYSGQQTLGNETIIDIFLYENQNEHRGLNNPETTKEDFQPENQSVYYFQKDKEVVENCKAAFFVHDKELPEDEHANDQRIVKIEEIEKDVEKSGEAFLEHNYCYKDDIISEYSEQDTLEQKEHDSPNLIIDHDYCLPHSQTTGSIKENPLTQTVFKIEKIWSCSAENEVEATLHNGDIYSSQNAESDVHKNYEYQEEQNELFSKNIEVDQNELVSMYSSDSIFTILLPGHCFKTTIELLPFLFKQLPLVTKSALNPKYKNIHPYAASSLEEYLSWLHERRVSAEWFRAKMVKELIMSANVSNYEQWNTKSIIMFGRAYGFTPFANYGIFKKTHLDEYNQLLIKHPNKFKICQSGDIDCELNIDETKNIELEKFPKRRLIQLADSKFESECTYVRQCAFDAGIILKSEEIAAGVLFNSSERVILQAVLCLAENLIRKARASRVFEGNFRENECILTVEDIIKVLHHRPELNFLLTKISDY